VTGLGKGVLCSRKFNVVDRTVGQHGRAGDGRGAGRGDHKKVVGKTEQGFQAIINNLKILIKKKNQRY
jgi:hypothetical protein